MNPQLEKLKKYVEEISELGIVDLSFRKNKNLPEIPIDPYSKDEKEKTKVAHWLLLNASIDQGELVGEAGNARNLLSKLYYQNKLGDEIFKIKTEDEFSRNIDQLNPRLGRSKKVIPRILAEVNIFVKEQANNDLQKWGKMFSSPEDIVEKISTNVYYMGKNRSDSARKKPWMYMRWMVRSKTDLRMWDHLKPSDLRVPLDVNIAKVAIKFGVLPQIGIDSGDPRILGNIFRPSYGWKDVETVTEFARSMFPDDPAKVDYPFFLLGTPTSEGTLAKQIFNKIPPTSIRWESVG